MHSLILLLMASLGGGANAQTDEDAGVRFFDGVRIDSAAVQTGGPSPFKVKVGGVTYGIKLVDPASPEATKMQMRLGDGTVKAVKRYKPCDRSPLEPIPPGGICLGLGWCNKAWPGIEFTHRHLWSNYHLGPPGYFTPPAKREYFLPTLVEPFTGPLPGAPYSIGIDCGDWTSMFRACREWGYATASLNYDHVNASSWDNCSAQWNGVSWVYLGCSRGCNNKRVLCTNRLPQCSDGYDNDGDCTADFAGARGLPPDPKCSDPTDDDESN